MLSSPSNPPSLKGRAFFSSVAAHVLVATLALASLHAPALADPPPWAPAHGWRKKNDPNYVGYTGARWQRDYGVIDGHCDTAAVGAAVGGVIGGTVGSQVGRGDGREVAILLGATIGAIIGARVGRDIDQTDRACMGHALELAGDGHAVAWNNASTGVSYRTEPARGLILNGRQCREFTMLVSSSARRGTVKGVACRRANGGWEYQR